MKLTILLGFVVGTFAFGYQKPMQDPNWREFKVKHGKFYQSDIEETTGYMNWKNNLKEVVRHNSKNKLYKLGMNQFSDMVSVISRLIFFFLLLIIFYCVTSNVLGTNWVFIF